MKTAHPSAYIIVTRTGEKTAFGDLHVGGLFHCNGTFWTKTSVRSARDLIGDYGVCRFAGPAQVETVKVTTE